MENNERKQEIMSSCSGCAEDCRESADYARYAFIEGDEENARVHVSELERRLTRLRAYMGQLTR